MPTHPSKTRPQSYSFGSSIITRSYSAGSGFRFGFNTQEKDKEVYNNNETYTATFWEYDGRLGRRWNLDPVDHILGSNYTVNFNTPTTFKDPNGLFGSRKEARQYKREHINSLGLRGSKIVKGTDGLYSIIDKKSEWMYTSDISKINRSELIGLQEDGVLKTMLIHPNKNQKSSNNSVRLGVRNFESNLNNYNIDKAVKWLTDNALEKSIGRCAFYVRNSLEAGGINTNPHPVSAKNYGPYLIKWGFSNLSLTDYSAKKGDIRVFQPYFGGSEHGHIDVFSGYQWISDFKEKHSLPGRGFKHSTFDIYRWPIIP